VLPKTRTEFWKSKITDNVERDLKNVKTLQQKEIRLLVIWECALRGKGRLEEGYLAQLIERWFSLEYELAHIDKDGLRLNTIGSQTSQLNF